MVEESPISAQETVREWLTSKIAALAVALFCLFVFILGAYVAGVSLHDPDTCWLLAVGKFILDHGAVPGYDPFSYTMHCMDAAGKLDFSAINAASPLLLDGAVSGVAGRAFVPYQWLTEIILFLSYRLLGGYGVVGLAAFVLVMAFIVLPLAIFSRLRASGMLSLLVIVVGVIAASFHFLARPEIFSYLLFAIWLHLIAGLRSGNSVESGDSKEQDTSVSNGIESGVGETDRSASEGALLDRNSESENEFGSSDSRSHHSIITILAFSSVMLLWANMHTGFVFGLVALLSFCILESIESLLRKRTPIARVPWIVFAISVCVTFINPFGLRLWGYLPNLFFSPINKYIVELRPIGLSDLGEWTYYPYFLLSAISLVVLLKSQSRFRFGSLTQPVSLFSWVMVPVFIIAALVCRRLIPFTSLFLICEVAWLLRDSVAAGLNATGSSQMRATISGKIHAIFGRATWSLVFLLLALLGVFLITSKVAVPKIPQPSSFKFPFEAMNYLGSELPEGRCLNDPQFGDMMIWYLATDTKPLLVPDESRLASPVKVPAVFIDTRFDMYGPHLVQDFYDMANCRPGWKERLARYDFGWIFLRPKAHLVSKLDESEDWRKVYTSEAAVIYVRTTRLEPASESTSGG